MIEPQDTLAVITGALLLAGAALAQTTDTTPPGMVSFFAQPSCPEGWSAYATAEGRLLLGYTNTDEYSAEATVGTALSNATAPTHKHSFTTTVNVGSKGLAAASGSNHSGANPGSHSVPGSGSQAVDSAASGYPFVQRTVCRKDPDSNDAAPASTKRQAKPLTLPGGEVGMCSPSNDAYPYGTLAFFTPETGGEAPYCPDGWSKATYLSAYQVSWSGSNNYCVQIAFDGTDADNDGVLRGRGSDPAKISGGYKNELNSWSMTVWQNACGSGSQLAAYSWEDQQARSDFNFNFGLDKLQVLAGSNWNTAAGLNAGVWKPTTSGPQQYNFASYNDESGYTNSIQVQTEVPKRETISSTGLGDDKFSGARQNAYVDGLFLVPFDGTSLDRILGQIVGSALAAGQAAGAHTHSFSTSISLDEQKMVIASGSTEHLATYGTHKLSGKTSSSALALPYVQLLLCQKCDDYAAALPGTLDNVVIYTTAACPAGSGSNQGWTPVSNDLGRLAVGLAPGAANPGKTFGGAALQPLAKAEHTHKFSASVDISSHGVAADNGTFFGAYEAYGHAGTRSYSGTTGNPSGQVPYLATASCRPCGGSGQASCGN